MTVQSALSSRAHDMEYFLCIEGIGWPTDEFDLTSGFDGDVFTTNDLNGNLATVLGCTVRYGLNRPTGVVDSYNPRTGVYSPGSMSFTIQDQDDFLLSTVAPHRNNGTTAALTADLTYSGPYTNVGLAYPSTVVNFDYDFTVGSTVWIASREALFLSAGGGGGGPTYSFNCTRGYLGTPRGRYNSRTAVMDQFSWETGTRVDDYCRIWGDRRCILFAYVPGEVVGNAIRIYSGLLRTATARRQGNSWRIPTIQMTAPKMSEIRSAPTGVKVKASAFIFPQSAGYDQFPGRGGAGLTGWTKESRVARAALLSSTFSPFMTPSTRKAISIEPSTDSLYDSMAVAFGYNYRNLVPGGTAGAIYQATNDKENPQTTTDARGRERIDSFMSIGDGNFVKALFKVEQGVATNPAEYNNVITNITSYNLGSSFTGLPGVGDPVKILLDNFGAGDEDSTANRFRINGKKTRNPIDVLLMFLTSMNNEFQIENCTGGTATAVTFAGGTFTANEFDGFALFAVEDSNVGYARKIISNTATTVTVDSAFPNLPTAAKEYQIRNTVYDILPFGWGLGIRNEQIDIESFERIKEKYLSSASLGKFVLGINDKVNIWNLMLDNICVPYGILTFIDRSTGKLTAKYVGTIAAQDGLDEDYIAVTHEDILEMGDISYMPRIPAAKAKLIVRSNKAVIVNKGAVPQSSTSDKSVNGVAHQQLSTTSDGDYQMSYVDPLMDGKKHEVNFVVGDKDLSADESAYSEISINALFDNEDSINDFLVTRVAGLLKNELVPLPELDIKLDMSFILTAQVGSILSITDTTNWAPVNPFTGSRGWTNVVARVLSSKTDHSRENPGVMCRVQLINDLTCGRITSACDVSSKGSDAGGDYFVVHFGSGTSSYSDDPDDLDWRGFANGDLIELRDYTGALKEAETISGFGSTKVASPGDAVDGRIYVSGTIVSAIAAGDYLSFQPWSVGNTANMNLGSAYADSNETLGAGNDPARKYF